MNLDSLIELTWWWCFCIRNQRRFGVVPMFMQRKRRRFWPIKWLCLIYANRLALRINPGLAENTFSSFKFTRGGCISHSLLPAFLPWQPFAVYKRLLTKNEVEKGQYKVVVLFSPSK